MIRTLIFSFIIAVASVQLYAESTSYDDQKDEFIKTLFPVVQEQNQAILQERAFIESFFSKDFFITYGERIQGKNYQKLASLAKKYGIQSLYDKEAYLKKIDVIPPSLAISQSILASGWGTSAYASKYNNIYGHYTYTSLSKSRAIPGKNARIRVFDSIDSSVASYMHNLNTHAAYKDFRDKRAKVRDRGGVFGGAEALVYLDEYSEIGKKYSSMLGLIIKSNNLSALDSTMFYQQRAYLALAYPLYNSLLIP